MKVIVLGAGVIGVTSAYYLALDGHEVIVVDKKPSVAEECSASNGGQLSYSHVNSWSTSSLLKSYLKNLFFLDSCLNIKDYSNHYFYKWIYNYFKNSQDEIVFQNSKKLAKIAQLSRDLMIDLVSYDSQIVQPLEFDYKSEGILHFYRNNKIFTSDFNRFERFKKINIESKVLNIEQCLDFEPQLKKLADKKQLSGAILMPNDASGNCYEFTQKLSKICQEKFNVKFLYNHKVLNLLNDHKKITGINTNHQVIVGDAYVCAFGAISNNLLKGIGIKTDIYPVKGYSLSVNCNDQNFQAPTKSMTDIENKIVYSRFNKIFRVAGTIEMSGINFEKDVKNINFLKKITKNSFENYGDLANSKTWCGLRPFRSNSLPLIDKSEKFANLFLNMGHGSLGWTLALGSAHLLKDKLKK